MANPNSTPPGPARLLTSSQVAVLFGVHPKTVSRWVATGSLKSFKTPGGHHRFREADILPLMPGAQS